MANGKEHREIALVVGAAAAFCCASDAPRDNAIVETIGGALGGYVGGVLPDVIDPPIHPGHRSLGHGVLPVGATAKYYVENVRAWQEELRRLARGYAQSAARANSESERTKYLLLETLCQLAAGFVVGIGAGYVSHLAMDACTPKGLPLLA